MSARARKRGFIAALCVLGVVLFGALGVWQIERRAWKLDLIERVERRLAAAPVAMAPSAEWPQLQPEQIEYRRVRVSGVFQHEKETLVDALTEHGPGSWVLTPLRTADGVVLINRGFVPPERRDPVSRAEAQHTGPTTVTGLIRLSEPQGRILRPNEPGAGRWFSRDVRAIATTRGLGEVAPFFIDADATRKVGGYPIGGLTVVRFRNTHLIYALTWFGLAALSLAGLVLLIRDRRTSI